MKADLQRIFRGKGIYITLGIFLVFILLMLFAFSAMPGVEMEDGSFQFGVSIQIGEPLEEEELIDDPLQEIEIGGADVPNLLMASGDLVFNVMLPVMIFIAAADFSSGTVKNVLSSGTSRIKYYVSKLILACMLSALLYSFYIIVPTLIFTMVRGWTGVFEIEFINHLLPAFLLQLNLALALTCIGMFLIFVTKKMALVIGLHFTFLIAPTTIIMILSGTNERFLNLLDYEMVANMRGLADFASLSSGAITRTFLIGLTYIVLSTIIGLVLFRKSEIK